MMEEDGFQPGLRFSFFDGVILIAGAVGGVWAWRFEWWLGLMIVCVVVHFFLFCNVFRIARVPELIWAGAFVLLAGSAIVFGRPAWWMVFAGGLVVSSILIFRETRKPCYHGVRWRRWNPGLEEWWRQRQAGTDQTRADDGWPPS